MKALFYQADYLALNISLRIPVFLPLCAVESAPVQARGKPCEGLAGSGKIIENTGALTVKVETSGGKPGISGGI